MDRWRIGLAAVATLYAVFQLALWFDVGQVPARLARLTQRPALHLSLPRAILNGVATAALLGAWLAFLLDVSRALFAAGLGAAVLATLADQAYRRWGEPG